MSRFCILSSKQFRWFLCWSFVGSSGGGLGKGACGLYIYVCIYRVGLAR